ncbi:hypothetical protein Avbf_13772 [Armadillidium vulgare]|nr:hypothetical protein Avbf_13772 [Armadillidium vulgare]
MTEFSTKGLTIIFGLAKTNNHFVQSLSLRIPVKRISVLCFEYFASFLDGEILINCLELNLLNNFNIYMKHFNFGAVI